MSERDELAAVIVTAYGEDAEVECPCEQDLEVADAILASGYRKPEVIIEWAAVHAANGVPYNFHRTQDEAQVFVDSMAEVGHAMVVRRREHTPATYTEWEPAS